MKTWLVALAALVVVACGPEETKPANPGGKPDGGSATSTTGADNVAACKQFLNATKCGTADFSGSYNCELYRSFTCNVSAYFNCASQHYVCTNGMFDLTKLNTVSTDCSAKAVCN